MPRSRRFKVEKRGQVNNALPLTVQLES